MLALPSRRKQAEQIARDAGAFALTYFQQRDQLNIAKKGLHDMVSQADQETEQLIRRQLAEKFPDDGILGEEDGLAAGTSGFIWVVDPIDGTWCFINGIGSWCVSIACVEDGVTVVGVIFDPNSGELFSAAQGLGTTLNGRPIELDAVQDLTAGTISTGFSHRSSPQEIAPVIAEILAQGGQFHRHGSGALGLAWTAASRLIGYVEPHMNSWDCLAGLLMIREAGGWTNDFLANDGLTEGGPVLACHPNLRDHVVELGRHFAKPWQEFS